MTETRDKTNEETAKEKIVQKTAKIEDNIRRYVLNLEEKLSTRRFFIAMQVLFIGIFLIIIVFPLIYLFASIIISRDVIIKSVFFDPIMGDSGFKSMLNALFLSFYVATLAVLIDLIIGLPMAYILARYNFKGKNVLDTMIDLPLSVPTSALGVSIFLFWSTNNGISALFFMNKGFIDRGVFLIILAHVAFTFPYIVRTMKGIIEDIPVEIEHVARTLGAPSFTAFRTVIMPMIKEGILTATVLAFTRSLGETGATLIVAGIYETAPVVIVSWMRNLKISETAFLAMMLILISITLLTFIKIYARKIGFPIERIFPQFERKISSKKIVVARNTLTVIFFLLIVFVPAMFSIVYLVNWWNGSPFTGDFTEGAYYQVFIAPDNKFAALMHALITSIEIALLATIINLIIATPMALILVKKNWGKINAILDAMVDIPLVIPSSALGFTILYLWGKNGLNLLGPGFWMILLVHVSFTYPYTIRPIITAFKNSPTVYEEAAKTLGASDITMGRTILLPILRNSFLAAAILTFTRSMSETGATLIVMGLERTVPVLLVDLFEASQLPAAAFASTIMITISFMGLILLRILSSD